MSVTNIFTANTRAKASEVNQNFQDITSNPSRIDWTWTSYTPTWTSFSGSPSIGNGTMVGRYIKIGRLVTFNFGLIVGSTTTFGTGTWTFTLPIVSVTTTDQTGVAYYLDANGNHHTGNIRLTAASSFSLTPHALSNYVQATVPFTWATADQLQVSISYESAS